MRPGISVTVTAADRRRLEAIAGDRNSPQKHVWRAEIVLLSADGLGTVEIMRRAGKSKTCVWRWQERFAQEGVEGLWRDKTRPSRVKPLGQEVIDRVVALTAAEPPHELSEILCAGPVDHHARTNLSSNMMANWVFASPHSRGDIFHSAAV